MTQIVDIRHWGLDDVVGWLMERGFQEQTIFFKEHKIDGEALTLLNDNDVSDLITQIGPRVKFREVLRQTLARFNGSMTRRPFVPMNTGPSYRVNYGGSVIPHPNTFFATTVNCHKLNATSQFLPAESRRAQEEKKDYDEAVHHGELPPRIERHTQEVCLKGYEVSPPTSGVSVLGNKKENSPRVLSHTLIQDESLRGSPTDDDEPERTTKQEGKLSIEMVSKRLALRERSKIFRRSEKKWHIAVNETAYRMVVKNPMLLQNKKDLRLLAEADVRKTYKFAKGRSRSIVLPENRHIAEARKLEKEKIKEQYHNIQMTNQSTHLSHMTGQLPHQEPLHVVTVLGQENSFLRDIILPSQTLNDISEDLIKTSPDVNP